MKRSKKHSRRTTWTHGLALLALTLFAAACASPPSRVAMVVGHGAYRHSPTLESPAADAESMAGRLRGLGWDVTAAIDLPREQLDEQTNIFETRASEAAQAILFYAGHGMQVDGANYIVPIEFDPQDATVEDDLISLAELIERLDHEGGQLAVFLDASRDNPMAFEFARRSVRPIEIGTGLVEIPARPGLYIAYATTPGHVAFDGRGRHSPFTRALLENIDLRNQDVGTMFVFVRDQVIDTTGGSQIPWAHSSLSEPFWINADPSGETQP